MSLKNHNPVNARAPKRIALVIANPTVSTTTGWPVGFWWSELSHPWFVFEEKGYEVTLFSPDGGACVADALSDPNDASGYSAGDLISQGFLHSPALLAQVTQTRPVHEMDVAQFDAIVVAGGQAPMFSFEHATSLQAKFVAFYEAGKPSCALCHGTAVLAFARLSNGEYLVKGRTVTGFANAEEDIADEAVWGMGAQPRGTHLMPWRIEDRLKSLGANYVQAGPWRGFAVRDGNLITVQQNFSGLETAQALVAALGE